MVYVATAADFTTALAAVHFAIDHGTEISAPNMTLVCHLLEYAANTMDTTNILPPVIVNTVDDGGTT